MTHQPLIRRVSTLRTMLVLMCLCFSTHYLSAQTHAQQRTVTGQVSDNTGEPLIGVSILVKGTTIGCTTDIDGNFSLQLQENNPVLVFSYIGYQTQEVAVDQQNTIHIVMVDDAHLIEEVVVTALGIKRETKALTYNVQEIKTASFTAVKDANFVNSLAGKIAGVRINNSASGIGGSSRVVMRGTKSLFGENNALYVIDGVPILNTKNAQPEGYYESPDGGDTEPTSFLNPEDVETMSVLTGAAAAALYGGRGANGVVMITTKKGEKGKLRVNYSNNTQFMTPFVMPAFQNTYGTKGNEFNSWGAKLERPSDYHPKDFFQTAYTEVNALSASVGSETNQTYVSVSNTMARGLLKNNDLERSTVNIRNSSELIQGLLSLDMALTYTRHNDMNMMTQGQYHNPLVPLYLFPVGDDINKYKVYERYNPERNFKTQYWPYGNQSLGMQNPYWIVNKEKFENQTDKYSLTGALKLSPVKWFNIVGRVRIDNTYNTLTRKISASADKLFASDNGYYLERNMRERQTYADVLANFDYRFAQGLSLRSTLGTSIMDVQSKTAGLEGFLGRIPDKFTLNNIDTGSEQMNPLTGGYHDQEQAIFGTLQLGYYNVYLDITGRSEWVSSLEGTNNNPIIYPSAGLSAVVSEMVNIPANIISFFKVRGSYSEVGNAPSRFITRQFFGIKKGNLYTNTYEPATYLKPERTKAIEIGTNIRFWNDRINLDVTYYNSNTYNQIFNTPSTAPGIESIWLNAGKVNNWGVELSVGYKQTFGLLGWHSSLTYSLNRNTIKELIPEGTIHPRTGEDLHSDRKVVSEAGSYRMELRKGSSMGDIYVSTLRKDHNGHVHVDGESGAISAEPDIWVKAGNVNAKYTMGWNNSFTYGNFDVSFLIDARVGGVGVSATQALMDRYGTSAASAQARDNGGVWVNGGRLNAENYYKITGGGTTGVLSEYVYSSTNVRLREASIGYNLPAKWLGNVIQGASVSLIGKNLLMIYNKAPYDPEITPSTGTYFQGFDYFMQPSLRSVGFSVKVQL